MNFKYYKKAIVPQKHNYFENEGKKKKRRKERDKDRGNVM